MPRDTLHTPCRSPGCTAPALHMLPACEAHWRAVPGPRRRGLAQAKAALERDLFDGSARDAYNTAYAAALDDLLAQAGVA